MKKLFMALIAMTSLYTFADVQPSLIITTDDGEKVKVALLGDSLDESEVELVWELGGAYSSMYYGDFCYNGTSSEAVTMIELLNAYDLAGDEYGLVNIKANVNGEVTYDFFDGPNEMNLGTVSIYPCK